MSKTEPLVSTTNCGVCGKPLVYGTDSVRQTCSLCGKEYSAQIYCPDGHYVCDTCHSKSALDVLREILASTTSADPIAVLEQVMAHPSVPMHGPEHHAIVPAVIIAAVKNAGYKVPAGAIARAVERAIKVPGGWCGLYGDCGAAVGCGVAVSVLTEATPLKGKPRTLALGATGNALANMLDEQPRCCKRAARVAILSAVGYLRDKLDIDLSVTSKIQCAYTLRNRECTKQHCSYYGGDTDKPA